MQAHDPKYRPNAAVIVTDGKGHVLLCERSDLKYEGTWQTPQGGIDPGETAREAASRELGEELGLAPEEFEIIAESSQKYRYEWTEAYQAVNPFRQYVGQEQQFFLAKVHPDAQFYLDTAGHGEFRQVKWGSPADLVKYCWEAKRPGIEASLREFGLL
jgi:putative (di)nucleoside polyphosphate hydrolase